MESQNKNIYLIGLMGVGKSTLARELSVHLGHKYLDTDDEIEQRTHKTINHIFKQDGEPFFRKLEYEILTEHLTESYVVATGGGLPCQLDSMQYMNAKGLTIWLDIDLEILVERLWNQKEKRPLIANCIDATDLYNKLNYVRQKRRHFYNQAQIILSKKNITLADILAYM